MAIKVNGKLVAGLGKSAYEQAQEGGYTGTEEEFISALANIGSNPTAEGLPVNDVRAGTVRDGQSIAAGDVVNVQDGEVYRDVVAQKNVENEINKLSTDVIATCNLNANHSVIALGTSGELTVYLIDNNTGKAIGSATPKTGNPVTASVARLDDTHFVVQYIYATTLYARICVVSGTSISYGSQYTIASSVSENTEIITLSDSIALSIYDSSGLKCKVIPISGTTITTSGTEYSISGNTSAIKISATRLPDDDSGNKRVCICFADTGDGNKGKAVIATIDSANAVTFGDVVTISNNNTDEPTTCAYSNGKIYVLFSLYVYCLSEDLNILTYKTVGDFFGGSVSGNGTYYHIFANDSHAVLIGSSITTNSFGFACLLRYNNSAFENVDKYGFNSGYAVYPSGCFTDDDKILLAYADGGNASHGTTTILEISGNQIAGSFRNNSKDAIALESGEGGDTIKLGFGGYCACEGITAGQTIDSEGVTAYSPLDGWLKIIPWQEQAEPEIAPYVVGEYTGVGGTTVEIDVGFVPKLIIVKCISVGSTAEIQYGFLLSMPTQENTPGSYYISPTYLDNNKTVSVSATSGTTVRLNANSLSATCNHSGALYRYIAFR